MASITLQVAQVFPAGTSLQAYNATDWNPAVPPSGVPPGTPVDTQTVSAAGTVTFTNLTAGNRYFAHGTVSGQHKYVSFEVDTVPPGGVSLASEGVPGQPVPAKVVEVGGTDGTNVRPMATDAAGVQKVDVAGVDPGVLVPTSGERVSTNTTTQKTSSATSATMFSSNASAKARTVFNDSTSVLYLKKGTTASATDYFVKIAAGGYYEFPLPLYSGRVDGVWAAANGFAYVGEDT